MFGSVAGRSLLLWASALLLLWSIHCSASPVFGLSFRRKYTAPAASTSTVDRYPYNSELEAHIQSQPHYDSHPVMNPLTEDQYTIDYARDKNGYVWLVNSGDVRYYAKGQPAVGWPEMASHVLQQVQTAAAADRENGEAAKVLQFGRPFKPSSSPIKDWPQVWSSDPTPVPTPGDGRAWLRNPEWQHIRSSLEQNRHILMRDRPHGKMLAFRLLSDGQVEMLASRLF